MEYASTFRASVFEHRETLMRLLDSTEAANISVQTAIHQSSKLLLHASIKEITRSVSKSRDDILDELVKTHLLKAEINTIKSASQGLLEILKKAQTDINEIGHSVKCGHQVNIDMYTAQSLLDAGKSVSEAKIKSALVSSGSEIEMELHDKAGVETGLDLKSLCWWSEAVLLSEDVHDVKAWEVAKSATMKGLCKLGRCLPDNLASL